MATPKSTQDLFQFSVVLANANTINLQWTITPGYFLYKDRFKIITNADSIINLESPRFPASVTKTTTDGLDITIYRDKITLPVKTINHTAGRAMIDVLFQGCSDIGQCYPPQQKRIFVAINKNLEITKTSTNGPVTQNGTLNELFANSHWPFIMLSFFGFGLLLAFTPCVLPMIPVLSSIIVGSKQSLSARKAFGLSLSYVVSMSLTYALIGAIFATMGQNLQVLMQSPWSLTIFSLIFIGLALSMFDVYELRLPVALQNYFTRITRTKSHSNYLNAAFIGSLSILMLSPCVTPPLIAALGFIAERGNIILGIISLFCLSFGMGTPLLVIGTTAGKWLPKAGKWMNIVKKILGIMLLVIAGQLIMRVLPLEHLKTHHSYTKQHTVINTLTDAKTAIAKAHGQEIMVDFYADWCATCKTMAQTTLINPAVVTQLNKITSIHIDVSENNKESQALLHYFHVVAPPTFIFFDKNGQELKNLRLVGDVPSTLFIENLQRQLMK